MGKTEKEKETEKGESDSAKILQYLDTGRVYEWSPEKEPVLARRPPSYGLMSLEERVARDDITISDSFILEALMKLSVASESMIMDELAMMKLAKPQVKVPEFPALRVRLGALYEARLIFKFQYKGQDGKWEYIYTLAQPGLYYLEKRIPVSDSLYDLKFNLASKKEMIERLAAAYVSVTYAKFALQNVKDIYACDIRSNEYRRLAKEDRFTIASQVYIDTQDRKYLLHFEPVFGSFDARREDMEDRQRFLEKRVAQLLRRCSYEAELTVEKSSSEKRYSEVILIFVTSDSTDMINAEKLLKGSEWADRVWFTTPTVAAMLNDIPHSFVKFRQHSPSADGTPHMSRLFVRHSSLLPAKKQEGQNNGEDNK